MTNEVPEVLLEAGLKAEAKVSTESIPSADAWCELSMDATSTLAFPTMSVDSDKIGRLCFLYRGGENWLARFGKDIKSPEQIKNIRQEVRTISARWLKMQNVCVLFGAGASKYVTGFIGSGLFEHVRELLKGRYSVTILEAILQYTSKQHVIGKRFEEFLSQLSSLARLSENTRWPLDKLPIEISLEGVQKSTSLSEALNILLLDLERAIAISCNVGLPTSKLMLAEGEVTPHETFLAKLVARDPKQGRSRIFTTNYDTLVEQAMDRLGIIYSDGFTGTISRRFNPAIYDLDLHYPGEVTEGRVRRYDKVLHLYKLHGSINWRRTQGSVQDPYGISFDTRPLPTAEQVRAEKVSEGKEFQNYFEKAFGKGEGLAILPTAGKFGESLSMPFAHLFRSMGQALREPQTVLFIIGYSGWDRHINQIIEDALTNPGFSCVIVDPVPSQWGQNLCKADYCGRVYCFGGGWGKFEFFAQHILPDLEVLKTELAVSQTLRELRRTRDGNAESGGNSDV